MTIDSPLTSPLDETNAARVGVPEKMEEKLVIPVLAEHLEIGRRVVEYGRVTIAKRVEEHREVVALDPTLHEEIGVERIACDRLLTEAPAPRYEGDTLVLSVVEEVLVVEKRLRLREEVRITRRQTQIPVAAREVTLRVETVSIHRTEVEPNDSSSPELTVFSGPLCFSN